MPRVIPTGEQVFATLREDNLFYIDKTRFIQDWWERKDRVTLITRPRRFGKTLMLDTVETFFLLSSREEVTFLKDLKFGIMKNLENYREKYQ